MHQMDDCAIHWEILTAQNLGRPDGDPRSPLSATGQALFEHAMDGPGEQSQAASHTSFTRLYSLVFGSWDYSG